MDVVAIVALARSVDDEAPVLATELGLTAYETALMLRAPPPIVVFRTEERARTLAMLENLRRRGHTAVACELDAVASSESMFRPKSFRFEGEDFVGVGSGEEHRLPLAGLLALVRATHTTHIEETSKKEERKLSLGRAAMSGGLMLTKTQTTESKRTVDERVPVLYLFRVDAPPWLLKSTEMRYDGLAGDMRRSRVENFEVLASRLQTAAPMAAFDKRLLAPRAWPSTPIVSAGKHASASSAASVDLLAHIVAMSIGHSARPYR